MKRKIIKREFCFREEVVSLALVYISFVSLRYRIFIYFNREGLFYFWFKECVLLCVKEVII